MYYPLDIASPGRLAISRQRKYIWAAIALAVFVLLLFSRISLPSRLSFENYGSAYEGQDIPLRRTHVAVASDFGVHFDVHLPVATTIREIMGDTAKVQVFAHLPFRFGFQTIVDSLHLYDEPIQSPDDFMDVLTSGTPYPDEPGQSFDLIILGTCEIECVHLCLIMVMPAYLLDNNLV